MIIASDLAKGFESELGRDPMGTLHDGDPGIPRAGQAMYGKLNRPAYACGCQPAIHRFRCAACRRVVGWCYGGHADSKSESECCNSCVVTLWRAAERMGIAPEALAAELDRDSAFRAEVYEVLRRIFGGPPLPPRVFGGTTT